MKRFKTILLVSVSTLCLLSSAHAVNPVANAGGGSFTALKEAVRTAKDSNEAAAILDKAIQADPKAKSAILEAGLSTARYAVSPAYMAQVLDVMKHQYPASIPTDLAQVVISVQTARDEINECIASSYYHSASDKCNSESTVNTSQSALDTLNQALAENKITIEQYGQIIQTSGVASPNF